MPPNENKTTNTKSSTLAGKLLIAMPSMTDQRFEKAVIFMCAHDGQGAMGLRVDDQMNDVHFEKIIDQTGIKSDIAIDLDAVNVLNGGPVESGRGFLLHSGDFQQKDTIRITRDYGVSGTVDALREVVSGKGPGKMLFVMGHAGWTAGQLDRELQENVWLIANTTPEILFEVPYEDRWSFALKTMGIDPAMISSAVGHA